LHSAKYGIFFLPHKLGAISTAHEEEDVKKLIDVSEELAREIKGKED
jgi:glutamate-1-semialdehyde aminotransferase